MVRTHRERELKFETPSRFVMPTPEELLDGHKVRSECSVVELDATYFDTAQHSLLRHGVTLRRREGGDDSGWHLKVPAGSARTEIEVPLAAGTSVPRRLSAMVSGLAVGRLAPVATVRTTRQRTRVFDGDRLLLEIDDDEVVGTALGEVAAATTWHELEVELGDGGSEALLTEVGKRLIAAGATPGEAPSKLARTLDWSDPAQSAGTDAHGLVMRYLHAQVADIGSGDIAFRRGLDPVHKTRVAVRRFRSALRVFGEAWLDPDDARRLDGELSWYQNVLGEVRDREVLRARFADLVHGLPDELVLGPVSAMIDETLGAEQAIAREALTAAMRTKRYLAVLRSVEQWAANPPIRADVDLNDVFRMARNAQRTVRKRLKKALAEDSPQLLHRARKAAKRARYATELVAPAVGKSTRERIGAYKHAQDTLGEHQDSIIAAGVLKRLGAAATEPNQNGFTFGMLYERERAAAESARQDAHSLLDSLP